MAREYPRFSADFSGKLVAYDGPHDVTWVDLSRKGCCLQNTVSVVPGMLVDLILFTSHEEMPLLIRGAMVRWSGTKGIGIEFQDLNLTHQTRLDVLVSQLENRAR